MITIYDEVGHGENWFTVSEVAKVIGMKDDNNRYYGRNKMYRLLREKGILLDNNYPYQQFIVLGIVQMHRVERGNYTSYLPIFSMRGVNYLRKRLSS